MTTTGRFFVLMLALGSVSLTVFLTAGDPGTSWAGGRDKIDVVSVTEFSPGDSPEELGKSQLLRTKEGISFKLDTTDLEAGTGYTCWIFIDESDAELPGPPGLERFELRVQMGGSFAAADGSGQFSGFLPAGDLPAANGLDVLAIDDESFDDPKKADVLLLVRWHGEAETGLEYEQTHFINAGPDTNVTAQEAFHMGRR